MNARTELGREAEAILYAGGFRNAAAKHHGPFWTLYGVFAGNEHSGATHKQANPQDPRELARVLVARVQAEPDVIADEPEAPETVEETFAPGEGPFDPQPEPEQIPAHETHGETGEEAAADQSGEDVHAEGVGENASHSPDVGDASDLAGGPDGSARAEQPGRDDHTEERRDDPEGILDADYTLPEIELIPPELDPEFGSELLEWEGELAAEPEPAQDDGLRFIFGGNLEEKRTAAIGIVVQTAVDKMPFPINYAYFSELRNFAMGVAEGRWDNDPTKQAELAICEAVERKRRDVERVRDEKVGFLVHATLEQIEAFDPSADWPS